MTFWLTAIGLVDATPGESSMISRGANCGPVFAHRAPNTLMAAPGTSSHRFRTPTQSDCGARLAGDTRMNPRCSTTCLPSRMTA